MIIEVLKNETFEDVEHLPKNATEQSTGFDVYTIDSPKIVGEFDTNTQKYKRVDYIEYKTNLKVAINSERLVSGINKTEIVNYDMLAFPRSSISKYNLQLANSIGLIDQDYRGEILLRFNYIWQPEDLSIIDGSVYGEINFDKIYKRGEKICQLKITKREDVELILVNEFLNNTDRGEGGFGHTDKKKFKEKNSINESKRIMSSIESLYNQVGNPNVKPKTYTEIIKERNL